MATSRPRIGPASKRARVPLSDLTAPASRIIRRTSVGASRTRLQQALNFMRIAVVHDWLDTWRGGENTLAEIIAAFPNADLFALVDFLPQQYRNRLLDKRAHTSFLQRIPGAGRHFRTLLPLFPRAIESLDVTRYDTVISVSHAVAKGVRTTPDQLHICYCLTPMRYVWDLRELYLAAIHARTGIRRNVADNILNRLRDWDIASSRRVTHFVAISQYIRDRIRRCYDRDADVVYPPVDVEFFRPSPDAPREDYYFTASRWVPYKRVDLIVEAFRTMPDRRLLVAGDGPDASRIRSAAGSNVEFLGEVSHDRMRELLQRARAFIFAAEEDFGILPVEAQACGTPVVCLAKGGTSESIVGGNSASPTGYFFTEQSASSIAAAIRGFERMPDQIQPADCERNAQRFAAARFRTEFASLVAEAWQATKMSTR
jgi:glycosyltransferase involved in cell wall biosynthesis